MNDFKSFILCILIFAASLCCIAFIFDIVRYYKEKRFSRCAYGKVTSVRPYKTHDRLHDRRTMRVTRYSCTVSVNSTGNNRNVKVDSPEQIREGAEMSFWYDPGRPKDTLLYKSHNSYKLWLILMVACVITAIFAVMVL